MTLDAERVDQPGQDAVSNVLKWVLLLARQTSDLLLREPLAALIRLGLFTAADFAE